MSQSVSESVSADASACPFRCYDFSRQPWEGGTKAASWIFSPNPIWMPDSARGTESSALSHVTDWFKTLLGLAGADASVAADGKPLDGHDVWAALVSNNQVPSPRKEMVYNIEPGITFASGAEANKGGNAFAEAEPKKADAGAGAGAADTAATSGPDAIKNHPKFGEVVKELQSGAKPPEVIKKLMGSAPDLAQLIMSNPAGGSN